MTYHIVLIHSEDGIAAEVPALPGCLSQGSTVAEALENAKDAIETWILAHKEQGLELDFFEGIENVTTATVEVRLPVNA